MNAWSSPYIPVELGASIFVSINYILHSAARRFNLTLSSFEDPRPANTPELGIWTGEDMVLQTSGGEGWWDMAKLLWRYGLAPLYTKRLMKSTVDKFLNMYSEPIFPFASLSNAAYRVGLTAVTAATGEQFLKENGISEKFSNEIIQASTRVNYAQNLGLIHGLETMVCMATDGAMAVRGGNWQIFDHMVRESGATLNLNTSVQRIQKQPDGTYLLSTDSGTETFDEVVLTAPLQFSSLVIDPAPKYVPDQIPYVNLHVTLFASPHRLSPAAFNLKPDNPVPQFVLTTLAPGENPGSDKNGVGKAGFFSISVVSESRNPTSDPPGRPEIIYKIFSPMRIDAKFLSHILGHSIPSSTDKTDESPGDGENVTWIYRKLWQSYPYEYPRVTFDKIRIDDGLWYTSGIESFISTMETSALMGKNVARLLVDGWVGDGVGKEDVLRDVEEKVWGREEWDYEGLNGGRQQVLRSRL